MTIKEKKPRSAAQKAADKRYRTSHVGLGKIKRRFNIELPSQEVEDDKAFIKLVGSTTTEVWRLGMRALREKAKKSDQL